MVMEDEIDAQPDGSIVTRKAPMPLVDLRLARIQHTCGPRDLSSLMLLAVNEVVSPQASFPSFSSLPPTFSLSTSTISLSYFNPLPLLRPSSPFPPLSSSPSSIISLSPYSTLYLSLQLHSPHVSHPFFPYLPRTSLPVHVARYLAKV